MIIKTPAKYVLILSQNQLSSPRAHPMNCHVTAKLASTINEQPNNPIIVCPRAIYVMPRFVMKCTCLTVSVNQIQNLLKGFLVSKETVVLRRWEMKTKILVLSNELIKVEFIFHGGNLTFSINSFDETKTFLLKIIST